MSARAGSLPRGVVCDHYCESLDDLTPAFVQRAVSALMPSASPPTHSVVCTRLAVSHTDDQMWSWKQGPSPDALESLERAVREAAALSGLAAATAATECSGAAQAAGVGRGAAAGMSSPPPPPPSPPPLAPAPPTRAASPPVAQLVVAMGLAAAGHDAARAGSDDAYDQWVLRQLGAFAEAVGVADAAERLAVARYLRAQSHSNILLRWVSKKSDTPRASILLRAIGKARSEPGCLALRGQQPPGGEPGGVGGEAGGSGSGGHDHGIGGGDDDGISTTPLWAAPCAPALLRSETELGASGAGPGASRARRQHGRRA